MSYNSKISKFIGKTPINRDPLLLSDFQKWAVFQRSEGRGQEKLFRGQAPGPLYLLPSHIVSAVSIRISLLQAKAPLIGAF